jgi:hypothetical protein
MDIIALLSVAYNAGLQVRMDGARLIVCGPKRLAALAQELLSQKAAIMAVLEEECAEAEPCWARPGACYACGTTRRWRSVYGAVVCAKCHPPLHHSWSRGGKTSPWKKVSKRKKGIGDDASHVSSTGRCFSPPRR